MGKQHHDSHVDFFSNVNLLRLADIRIVRRWRLAQRVLMVSSFGNRRLTALSGSPPFGTAISQK
jgi:hypothetical protein